MTKLINRYLLLTLGWLSLLLGILGIVLPLLPTTPFVLLAAVLFSKSSPALHQKLLAHRLMGPIIRDWEEKGVIKLRTKWVSTITMIGLVSYPLIFKVQSIIVQSIVILIMACVLVFIWSRPSF